jgi:predicted DNA-binding protein with PD1-like motif
VLKKVTVESSYLVSFPKNSDVLDYLTELSKKNGIKNGIFSFIGALSSAKLTEYDQESKKYLDPIEINQNAEVLSISGNIILKNDEPFVHAHASLSLDGGARCVGGHIKTARVFALEGRLDVFDSRVERSLDEDSGLYLLPS